MHDYAKLGLRCGIEIHQQLETHKLFCGCPSQIREDAPHGTITRRIKAVAGELGGVDPAALHELLKGREFVYEYYEGTNCLVELDEEPPRPLNTDALEIALEAALLLHARPVDEVQVMRKTVIDGSNTSGFQRTMLIATGGWVEVHAAGDGGVKEPGVKKRITIPTICLEEDASRIIKKEGGRTWYRLDRLGIPLVEIGTGPDITSPQEAREVAEAIGMLLRATGKVKRGLGTIRQDVNVSIRGGERIEIKGVQALNDIPGLVENEAGRQVSLLAIRDELKARGFSGTVSEQGIKDVTPAFKDCESKIVKGKSVFGIRVPKFAGLVGKELMPGYRFGTELAGIAAETAGLKGIFHSDELPAYGITEKEVAGAMGALGIGGGNDAFVLVAAGRDDAVKALIAIAARCDAALKGVPKEVRRADGVITRFMRPLPGSARMYPETDEPLVAITEGMLASIRLPMTPEEQKRALEAMGLGAELANQLVHSRVLSRFKELSAELKNTKPSVIASALLAAPEGVDVAPALGLVDSGKVAKESMEELVAGMAAGKSAEEVANGGGLFLLDDAAVKKRISGIVNAHRGEGFGRVMGIAMSELRGKADAQLVKRLIEERMK